MESGEKALVLKEKRQGMLFTQRIEHRLAGDSPEVHPYDLCVFCSAEIIFMCMAQIHQDPLTGGDLVLYAVLFHDQTAGKGVHDQMIIKIVSVDSEGLFSDIAHRVTDHKRLFSIAADKWHYIIDIWKHLKTPSVYSAPAAWFIQRTGMFLRHSRNRRAILYKKYSNYMQYYYAFQYYNTNQLEIQSKGRDLWKSRGVRIWMTEQS